jgi:peptidoglycan/xylan/chitin deacetylase (PgdA/CDA1 family)
MGNPLKPGVPDLNAIGFAEYGHRRGIFRVLDTLEREGIKATMIVSGIMAERHAEIVRRISEEGHDIVAHSYAMDVIPIYLDEEEERADIRRTMDLIVRATGERPTISRSTCATAIRRV